MATDSRKTTNTVLEVLIKIGFLLLLVFACFQILFPFLAPVVWGLLICIILYPVYRRLVSKLGGRKKISAIIVTGGLLVLLTVPSFFLFESLVEGMQEIGGQMQANDLVVPPPPDKVKDWPIIGDRTFETWKMASENLEMLFRKYEHQITAVGKSLLSSLLGTGKGLLEFILSIIIAGVLLTYSESGNVLAKKLFTRIVGERGDEFATMSRNTILNVAKGIIGVAIIQALFSGIGFGLAGLPYAGLWTMVVLILAIIQLPLTVVFIPVVIYLYSTMSGLGATLWTVYFIAVGLSDNVLKPILLGKGAKVPMLVVFLGAIGGFIAFGFIGLFAGAILLSLGYTLFLAWINETELS